MKQQNASCALSVYFSINLLFRVVNPIFSDYIPHPDAKRLKVETTFDLNAVHISFFE
jgi:hypothetical protein